MASNSTVRDITAVTAYAEYYYAKYAWIYVSPFLIVLGTIGNVLSIIVLLGGRTKASMVTTIYLLGLACSDMLALYTGLLQHWILNALGVDFRHFSETSCRLTMWIKWTSVYLSAWLLVCLTLSRAMAVCCPFTMKSRCTPKVAAVTIVTITATLLTFNFHSLIWRGDLMTINGNETTIIKCIMLTKEYERFIKVIFPWPKLLVFCILPFTAILVGNTSIIYKMVLRRKAMRQQVAPFACGAMDAKESSGSLSAMLVMLNVVYLLCTTPIMVYSIMRSFMWPYSTTHMKVRMDLMWTISNLFMYLNNSINFILYFLSGSDFRQETKALICIRSRTSSKSVVKSYGSKPKEKNGKDFNPTHNTDDTTIQATA